MLLLYAGELSRRNSAAIFDSNLFRPPHLSEGRLLQPGQRIHESALSYLNGPTATSPRACKAKFRGQKDGPWCLVQDNMKDILDGKYKDFVIEKDLQSEAIEVAVAKLKDVNHSQKPFPLDLVATLWSFIRSGKPMPPV